jgi:hypothetical protein
MDAFLKVVGAIAVIFAVVGVASVIGAYPTKWLINWLISPGALVLIFGTPKIGFAQTLGINILCSCLFKSTASSDK